MAFSGGGKSNRLVIKGNGLESFKAVKATCLSNSPGLAVAELKRGRVGVHFTCNDKFFSGKNVTTSLINICSFY